MDASRSQLYDDPKGDAPLVNWKWHAYRSFAGRLSIGKAKRRTKVDQGSSKGFNEDGSIETIFYHPPTWLSNAIIHVFKGGHATDPRNLYTGFKWTLNVASYNSDPNLARAVQTGNLRLLQDLFARNEAHPNDLMAPSGRSLLNVAICSALARKQYAINLIEFLITQGANLNARSQDGRTPLLLSAQLMQNEALEPHMQEIATILMKRGAEICDYSPEGFSVCSLIFSSSSGLQFLQSRVSTFVSVTALEELGGLDLWIFAAIANSQPEFKSRLQSEIREFCTPPSISSTRSSRKTTFPLDMETALPQITGIENKTTRVHLIRGLCRQGGSLMLQNLVQSYDIDLQETINASQTTYLTEAVSRGQYNVAELLLANGAEVSGEDSALDVLFERWNGRQEEMLKNDGPLFDLLLRHTTERCPNALARSIANRLPFCSQKLIELRFMRTNTKTSGLLDRINGSEVMEAIKYHDVASVQLLIEHGAMIEFCDSSGYTPLMQAVDKGLPEIVQCLLYGGANESTRSEVDGVSAFGLGKRNVKLNHPRRPQLRGAYGFSQLAGCLPVDRSKDEEILKLLHQARSKDRLHFRRKFTCHKTVYEEIYLLTYGEQGC
ncbi:MAG: Ankyrin-2 [Bathelium mastoideum]|nr:MAG: Ankyrin-2 [Bathelium mastoideum]